MHVSMKSAALAGMVFEVASYMMWLWTAGSLTQLTTQILWDDPKLHRLGRNCLYGMRQAVHQAVASQRCGRAHRRGVAVGSLAGIPQLQPLSCVRQRCVHAWVAAGAACVACTSNAPSNQEARDENAVTPASIATEFAALASIAGDACLGRCIACTPCMYHRDVA